MKLGDPQKKIKNREDLSALCQEQAIRLRKKYRRLPFRLQARNEHN